jgi:hypothetical protein
MAEPIDLDLISNAKELINECSQIVVNLALRHDYQWRANEIALARRTLIAQIELLEEEITKQEPKT